MTGTQELINKYREYIDILLESRPEYFKGYVNYLGDASIRTKYYYLKYCINFIEWCDKDIKDLVYDDYINYLSTIEYSKGKETTASYRIAVYSALKRFCEYLYVSGKTEVNYMLNIKRPKFKETQETIEKREKGYLTEQEIKQMMKFFDNRDDYKDERLNIRDKTMILTFLCTGIRQSALIALDLNDIDLKKKTLTVTEKGTKVRKYDIPDKLVRQMGKWLEARAEMLNGTEVEALFIAYRTKKRISIKAIEIAIKECTAFITDRKITAHKLRATYGTQLYNKTNDIFFVQQCMGHSDARVTQIYIRDKKADTKKAGNIMQSLL